MYFDGELTFGGDSSQTKNEQDHQAPPKKINKVNSQLDCNQMMSLVPASKFSIPKNASSKSVTRDQDQQNTNLEGSMDSLILPHSTSMAEYQGYNHNQQVRPLS